MRAAAGREHALNDRDSIPPARRPALPCRPPNTRLAARGRLRARGRPMTAARGVALGALVVAIAVVAVVLLRGGSSTTYKLRFQNAGQLVKDDDVQVGGRRVGSVRDIKLTDDNQAEITIAVDDDFAPLHEGTTAIDPRDLAVGHRQPLHRARRPGPNNRPKLADGALLGDRQDDVARRPRPALQHARRRRRARRLQQVIQGIARPVRRPRRAGQPGGEVLRPGAVDRRARLVNEVVRDQQTFTGFLVRLVADGHARSPRGATTSRASSPTRTRPRPRSATRTRRSRRRSASCRTRCARRTRRS